MVRGYGSIWGDYVLGYYSTPTREATMKIQVIISVDENVERLGASNTAGGIEKWCSRFGKRSGGFSKGYTQSYHVTRQFHLKTYIHRKICTPVFVAVLLILAKISIK